MCSDKAGLKGKGNIEKCAPLARSTKEHSQLISLFCRKKVTPNISVSFNLQFFGNSERMRSQYAAAQMADIYQI